MQVREISHNFCLEDVVPFFQPIMDFQGGGVWGYECLARLIYPGEHIFLPSDFLYLVEKNSCQGELTQKIFHQSAQYFSDRQVNWSINLCETDVLNVQTALFLERQLQEYPNANRVALEISSHTLCECPEQFRTFLLVIKTLGIQILIDRFNQPERQLLRLLDYPIDGVKVDASQIKLMSEKTPEKFQQILEKARKNDVQVIAEHIESQRLYACIRQAGVEYGQGFYFSQPLPSVV